MRKGYKFSKEVREKMSKSKLGINNSMYGKIPWNKNKKNPALSLIMKGNKNRLGLYHSEETKRKISEKAKERFKDKTKHPSFGKKNPKNSERMRINNPMFNIETAKKAGKTYIERCKQGLIKPMGYRKNLIARKECSQRMRNGGAIYARQFVVTTSKPQKEMYFLIKKFFPSAVLEYPLQTKKTIRFLDVAIPDLKYCFEFNGKYWHKEREVWDKIREQEIINEGWVMFNFNEDSIDEIELLLIKLINNGDKN